MSLPGLTRLQGRSPFGEAKARQPVFPNRIFLMDARIILPEDALRAFVRA
jgi:hypothetical protein